MNSAAPAHAPFEVLLLGGDLGVYALARSFHEVLRREPTSRFVVEDDIEAKRVEPVVSDREILYSLVPQRLLMRYLLDPKLRRRVAAAVRRGIVNPLKNRAEGPRRRAYAAMAQLNQVKKFATYYPRATDSGF